MNGRAALPILAVALLGQSTALHAAVYHCRRGGRDVYTDQPCTPDADPAKLPKLDRADPSRDPQGMARDYDRHQAKAHAQRDAEDAQWLKHYRAEKAREARIRKGLVDGHVVEGMTPDEVERVLGVPESSLGSRASPHRWTYRNGHARSVVRFRDGRVSGISRSGRDAP